MPPWPLRCIAGFWILFLLIWTLAADRTKRTIRTLSGWPRYVQIGLNIPALILLFDRRLDGPRFLPDTEIIAWAGVAMTAAGIAFAVWARFVLGQNWSSQITLKQGHELVRRGPYALVRHPIYSGVLLALLGTAVCIGEVRALIAFALFTAGWWLKARAEEALMLEQFGEPYRLYRAQVKALIPFVL